VPASLQVLLAQHGPSFFPHGWQVAVVVPTLPLQARSYVAQPLLVGNVLAKQQRSPDRPQVHLPDLHSP
jgi:hypothetical protein